MEWNLPLGKGFLALSPLIVFLMLYLVLSICANDFYAVPIVVAFMFACLYSLCILPGKMSRRIETLTRGAANPSIMLMIWIFILAGAFASTAKTMGAVEATVNVALGILPSHLLLAGLFLAACFISLSVGTSVGTIAALAPIGLELANQTGTNVAMMTAIVVGGAFFGDNLSFISDTTIVATRTQGCLMRDKFRMNIRIALPAAIIAMVVYILMGFDLNTTPPPADVDLLLVVPYLFVLIAAICGMDVILVLALALLLSFGIGFARHTFDFFGWLGAMNTGIMGMSELVFATLMAGGMIEAIRQMGGINFILQRLVRRIHGARGAEACMATLITLIDICTANNTIAILTVGPLAKDISTHYGVDPRRSASILDTFSCFAQGLIPYGAQLLIASGLAKISPLQIIPYLYYPFLLGIISTVFIFIHPLHEKNNFANSDAGSIA